METQGGVSVCARSRPSSQNRPMEANSRLAKQTGATPRTELFNVWVGRSLHNHPIGVWCEQEAGSKSGLKPSRPMRAEGGDCVCSWSRLCLASTNGARSRMRAEHVGHAQGFPPLLWTPATVLWGWVCNSC